MHLVSININVISERLTNFKFLHRRNEEFGRHVLVKEPVKRGDVIFAEEPFASVKLPDKDLPHPYYCDYCCSSDSAMIG